MYGRRTAEHRYISEKSKIGMHLGRVLQPKHLLAVLRHLLGWFIAEQMYQSSILLGTGARWENNLGVLKQNAP